MSSHCEKYSNFALLRFVGLGGGVMVYFFFMPIADMMDCVIVGFAVDFSI
jgi:hypothetical protein